MGSNTGQIPTIFSALLELERKNCLDPAKINPYIDEFNQLVDTYQATHAKGIEKIGTIPFKTEQDGYNEAYYHQFSEKIAKMQIGLNKMYYSSVSRHLGRPSENQKYAINQTQQSIQTQEIRQTQITTISQAIETVNTLQLPDLEKKAAISNLQNFEQETKKDKPDLKKIKELLEWATYFSDITGTPILSLFVKGITKILEKLSTK